MTKKLAEMTRSWVEKNIPDAEGETLRTLIAGINESEIDTDVYVDGHGWICICPPVQLTQAGMEKFGRLLDVKVDEKAVCGATDEEMDDVWEFLVSLAGYCSEKNYEEWFEGETANEITTKK